jgi:hypothetical protein
MLSTMHFLEEYLVLHPVTLYIAAVSLYGLNLALYAHADRKRMRVTALQYTPAQSLRARLSSTVIGALFFLISGLFFTGELRALFVGGFLIMQIGSITLTISNLQATNVLLRPNAVTGQIIYSQSTVALLNAANILALSIFSLAVFALTGSPSFLGASWYLAATSVAFRRRARQYALKERSPGATPV